MVNRSSDFHQPDGGGDDRWLYGIQDFPDGRKNPTRIAIEADSPTEILPGDWLVGYNSLMVNPARPMIVSRDHNYQDYYYNDLPKDNPEARRKRR